MQEVSQWTISPKIYPFKVNRNGAYKNETVFHFLLCSLNLYRLPCYMLIKEYLLTFFSLERNNNALFRISMLIAVTVYLILFLSLQAYASEITPDLKNKETIQRDPYPDQAGKDAIRLWSEKENQRAINEAIRRYWDYWNARQPGRYSAYRQWYELEETQRWLEDPDHNPPPPPVPPGRFMRYSYPPPYMYYLPPWADGPWYFPSYRYPPLYRPKNK